MPTPQFPGVPDYNPGQSTERNLQQLYDAYIGINRYLTYLLSSLDTMNINRLDAKVIIADTITADKMNVTELSAITANLGHITAGLIEAVTIVGSLIKTANSGQRVELSSSENLLKAVGSDGSLLRILPNFSGSPVLAISSNPSDGYAVYQFILDGKFIIRTDPDTDIELSTNGKVEINADGGLWVNGVQIA